jgi:tetratricopeptide (TPR) repeat protein
VGKTALDEALELRVLRKGDENCFEFRSADLADDLAAAVQESRRSELHHWIARIMIEKRRDPILIGYHYERAGLAVEAAEFLETAGTQALAGNDVELATVRYGRAVELVESQPRYEVLGDLYERQRDWAGSAKAYLKALGLAQRSEDVEGQIRIHLVVAPVLLPANDYQEAAKHAAAVTKFDEATVIEHARAQLQLATIAWLMGRLRDGEDWSQRSIESFLEHGDEANLAAAKSLLGLIVAARGRLDQANSVTRSALKIYEKMGDDSGRAYCLVNLGRIAVDKGDFDQASSLFAVAQEFFEELERAEGLLVVHTAQGRARLRQGQAAEAITELGQAEQWARELGQLGAFDQGEIYLLTAEASLEVGQLEPASSAAEVALNLVEAAGNQMQVAIGHALLARIEDARGEAALAADRFQSALALFEVVGNPAGLLRTRLAYAHHLSGQGEFAAAKVLENEVSQDAARLGLYLKELGD